jgi:hypothetical protein
MNRGLLVGFAVLALAAPLSAQDKPNFAGRWAIAQDTATGRGAGRGGGGGAAGGRGDMGSGWGSNITIAQTQARLTVEYMFFTRGDMQPPLKFAYALDGTETKNTVMMGRGMQTQVSKTTWDGAKLVITTQHPFVHPETGQSMTTEVKQILSLESPASMVVETQRAAILGGPASTTRTTYRLVTS